MVIDETPAVGIGAGAACDPYKTFPLKNYHSAVLKAMIDRDKNHPCVVLWSLGNEPDTEHFPESARDYWRPLYEQAHAQDPQGRPVTMVCCQNDYTKDITTRTMDVVCINRYYGWYNLSGDLDNASYAFRQELDFWKGIDKPLILSEYGADTVAGLHGVAPEMFTEEFQVEYYKAINAAAQMDAPDSIRSFYKTLVALRKKMPVISAGKIEFLYPDNADLLAYRRYDGETELLVLCNLREREIAKPLPVGWTDAEKLLGNYPDTADTLRPYECVVLKK